MKKSVLRNFTKFTGKHLCQSFFFNKVICLLFSFLLKHFIVFKDLISLVLALKRTTYEFTCAKNACEIKKLWSLCLQPAEPLFFTDIFMLNGKLLFLPLLHIIAFFKSKLIHCRKDTRYKRYVIK